MRGSLALQRGMCDNSGRGAGVVLFAASAGQACLQPPSSVSQQGRCNRCRSAASCSALSCTCLLLQHLLVGFSCCVQSPHHDCVQTAYACPQMCAVPVACAWTCMSVWHHPTVTAAEHLEEWRCCLLTPGLLPCRAVIANYPYLPRSQVFRLDW